MNKLITFLACLAVSSVTSAATSNLTSSFDKDPDILLASNDKTWSYAAYNANGLANVREFHDMGKSGVQQIDYVVNCGNQTMAMSGFQIHTAQGSLFPKESIGAGRVLNFYAPVIEHDKQIAANVCGKLMALNGYSNN